MTLDTLSTLAFAAAILWLGDLLRKRTPLLARYNLPPPVLSGLIFASLAWLCWGRTGAAFVVDSSLRLHFQSLFFATIGLNSNWPTARGASLRALTLWSIGGLIAVTQNLVGIGLALAMGAPAALGLACGSASLVGGPVISRAFSSRFEAAGLANASEIGIAASAFGIIAASLLGNPVATLRLRQEGEPAERAPGLTAFTGLGRHLAILVCLAWAGEFAGQRFPIPAYIVALAFGLMIRYLDDRCGRRFALDGQTLGRLGAVLSSMFLAHAMMDLRLEQLSALTWPIFAILATQITVTVAIATWLVRWRLGGDYESSVSTAGLIGFALGITPNVVANMTVLGRRYGPAPETMLAVPIVGTFLMDLIGTPILEWFLRASQRS